MTICPSPRPTTLESLFELIVQCRAIEDALNNVFLERADVVRSALLALLINEHVYQIGAPGTAKSLLIRSLVQHLETPCYLETLMTGETTLSSLMGAEQVPEAHVVFLDEVFRAPKETILGLLPVLNERIAYLPAPRKIPLLTLFAASNQNPSPADGLDAFYDRFTFRSIVRPIASSEHFRQFLCAGTNLTGNFPLETGNKIPPERFMESKLGITDRITLGKSGLDAILHLRERFSQEGIWISDRRWRKVLLAGQAVAAYSFHETVVAGHFKELLSVLWTYPTEVRIIERILQEIG
ncbi:MAG: AAA family ATPase [Leptospirales bacterium]